MKLLLTLLSLSLLMACGGEPPPELGAGALAPLPAPAATARATRDMVTVWREVPATVRSLDHIQVSSETTGRVLRVHAEVGQSVERGELLAELDPSTLESARDAALAELELARAESERVQRLHSEKVASERELDAAQTMLKQAQARLQIAETALGKAQVLSPVDGVVEERLVGPGDLAVPGKPLYSLYDPKRLCFEAHVPLGDRDHTALGTGLSWRIDSERGTGEVSEVAPSSDPRSRTVRIRVPLPQHFQVQGEEPAPGAFGTLRYRVGEREEISIPRAALFRVGQVEMVLVRTETGWRRRAVRAGARLEDRVEILAGLRGGEEVGLP